MRSYSIYFSLFDLPLLTPQGAIILLQVAGFPSFSWLNNIPLYIYHIFFIHLSTDGHLGCSYVLAIVNNATMNMGCSYLFNMVFSFPSDILPEVDYMVILVLIF